MTPDREQLHQYPYTMAEAVNRSASVAEAMLREMNYGHFDFRREFGTLDIFDGTVHVARIRLEADPAAPERYRVAVDVFIDPPPRVCTDEGLLAGGFTRPAGYAGPQEGEHGS